MSRRTGNLVRIRLFGVALVAASVAVVAWPLQGAQAGPEPTGTLSGSIFPGSAIQMSSGSFAPTVTASGLSSAQTIKSFLITLPASGWAVTGPAVGSSSARGWTVRSRTDTSICWGSKTGFAGPAAIQLGVDASTTASLGTATWTVAAHGDTGCARAVKPALAQSTANVYVAVAQIGSQCAATANCSTQPVSSINGQNSVEIIGTGSSSETSYVSAAVLEELPAGFSKLTCPERASYDPDLGQTAHTLVSGGARAHSLRYTMAQELVHLVSDNGAARMDVCLRSEQPFATKYGGTASYVGDFKLGGTGNEVKMYDGFVPACGTPAVAPCITSQHKTQRGDMVWEIVLPPGDPYVH